MQGPFGIAAFLTFDFMGAIIIIQGCASDDSATLSLLKAKSAP